MRLWSRQLIKVLPNKMLVSQWRELIAIKRQWEKGTLIHPLVSYVKQHPIDTFHYYTYCIYNEMIKRNIKAKESYYDELMNFNPNNVKILRVPCIYPEHDNEYFAICYYNLKEKYLRGIINQEEWDLIEKRRRGI